MSESDRATRLKMLKIRSWRRGMKEMDLILGAFADNGMADLDDATLALYEELLEENDNELYTWFTGSAETPAVFQQLVQLISKAHNLN